MTEEPPLRWRDRHQGLLWLILICCGVAAYYYVLFLIGQLLSGWRPTL